MAVRWTHNLDFWPSITADDYINAVHMSVFHPHNVIGKYAIVGRSPTAPNKMQKKENNHVDKIIYFYL